MAGGTPLGFFSPIEGLNPTPFLWERLIQVPEETAARLHAKDSRVMVAETPQIKEDRLRCEKTELV